MTDNEGFAAFYAANVSALIVSLYAPTPAISARCRTRCRRCSNVPWPGGIGTWRALIGFTNISKQACTIGGYPDVVAVDRSGATVSGAENPASALVSPSYPAGALVTLAPGDQAGAETSGGEIESGPTRVDVPPGGAASFAIVSATAYGGGTHIVTLTRLTFTLPGNGGQLQMATIIPVTRPNETGPYPLSETALVAGTGGPNS